MVHAHVSIPLARGGIKLTLGQRKFFIDNLLVRIHFIIVMIRWAGPFEDKPFSRFCRDPLYRGA